MRGRSQRRISIAALACYKQGERSRLIYRPKRHVDHKRSGRRSFTWTDYRDLLTAAHQQLGAPIVLVRDNLNVHKDAWLQADRNFAELLQELRVTQTGVQILFAFLLTLAFAPRFPTLDTVQRAMDVTTLLLAMLAAALFTAPAALHRALSQQHAKPVIVRVSSRLARIGMWVLMLAFTGSVLPVVDVPLGRVAGIAAGAGTLLVCVGLWRILPWMVRRAIVAPGKDWGRTWAEGAPGVFGKVNAGHQGENESHDFGKLIKSHPS